MLEAFLLHGRKYAIWYIIAVFLFVVGFGALLAASDEPLADEIMLINEAEASVSHFAVPKATDVPTDAEDYAIQWDDPGFEAHVRFILNKPEEPVYYSDVCGVQALAFILTPYSPHGVMLNSPPDGTDTFTTRNTLETSMGWRFYENAKFPPVRSLSDLQHFPELQIFCLTNPASDRISTDLTGIGSCDNLKVLILENIEIPDSSPIGKIDSLRFLSLSSTGLTNLSGVDNLQELSSLIVKNAEIPSLEPLTSLSGLRYLQLNDLAVFPSLEPLKYTSLEYLSLLYSAPFRSTGGPLDFSPIAEMPSLVLLRICNFSDFDKASCTQILNKCNLLSYLDIHSTMAATEMSETELHQLTVFVK